jgi:hypothetical protein
VSVQPEFNRDAFRSLANKSNSDVLFQYFQLVETRSATRHLLTQLDDHYRLQTPDGSYRAVTQCFLLVLQRTASEIFYLLSQFRPQPSKRKKVTSTARRVQSRMTEDHYLSTGMKRTYMLANLKRVLKHWELVTEEPRAGEWGSVQFRSGQYQVFVIPEPMLPNPMQVNPSCMSLSICHSLDLTPSLASLNMFSGGWLNDDNDILSKVERDNLI